MRASRAAGTLILLATSAVAVDTPRFVERFTSAEGLSQNSVYAMVQDRLGFLWVGTENGVNRYDGYGFRVFGHDPDNPSSLPSNQVRALLEDRGGSIWVGTADAGLARYDYRTDTFSRFGYDPDDPFSLAHDDVRAIVETPDGNLWIGTDQGVSRLEPGGSRFRRYLPVDGAGAGAPQNSVLSLAVDPGGRVWTGTERGLFRHDDQLDRFVPYADPAGGFEYQVWTLAFQPPHYLWAGTYQEGAARLDLEKGEQRWWRHDPADPSSLSGIHVSTIHIDSTGRIWIGTADRGLDVLGPGSDSLSRFPFPYDLRRVSARSTGVSTLLEDRSHILWIGTGFDGLLKIDLKASGLQPVPLRLADGRELGDRVVFAIAQDREGTLWVGGADGLYRVDSTTGITSVFHPDPERPLRPVYAVHPENDGTLWLGTWQGGLINFDPATARSRVFRHDPENPSSLANDFPLSLLEDSRGRFWVGTWGGGVDLFDRATGRFTHHRAADGTGLASDRIRALCEGADGTLWVGTTGGGVSHFDPEIGRFITYMTDPESPTSLSHDDIAYIHRARDGAIWFATAVGLSRFDPVSQGFRRFRVIDGMANDAFGSVLEDEAGMIWTAHLAGLSKLDPSTGTILNFDLSDGLAGMEFNAGAAFTAAGGVLMFGGVGGVTAVKPGLFNRNPHLPRTVLTSFSVYGQPWNLGASASVAAEVRLRHHQDFLGFEFTGLEFTAPQSNTYAYRLTGYHQDWVDAGRRRFASYTNLPPGTYTFEVRSANNHGVWGEPARLRILIEPPFWRTWWFRGALLAALLILTAAAHGWRTRALRLRLAEQERLVCERTAQLAEANAELQALASHDELTGAANRRLFNEFLDAEWRRATRFARPVSLALVDIDDFKRFNDSFGHPAGDACLVAVAGALRSQVNRPGDLLARYGGEEFVVVLSETSSGEAAALCERLRRSVVELAIPHAPDAVHDVVTVSVGAATVVPGLERKPSELLAAADAALYTAKVSGKNRVAAGPADVRSPAAPS